MAEITHRRGSDVRGAARRSCLMFIALLAAGAARAQVIPIRVAPIAEADQFAFYPASNFGMGSVGIALRDTLADPYANPALGARIRRATWFGAPTFFSVSNEAGNGQTYPIGGLVKFGRVFAGGAVVSQEIEPARPRTGFFPGNVFFSPSIEPGPPPLPFEPNRSAHNRFGSATLGYTLPANVTIAASGTWATLNAREGVELLFAGSQRVRQAGDRSELRIGALREWGARALEAVAVRGRMTMEYDVGYAHLFWDPGTRQQRMQVEEEHGTDRSTVSALQLRFEMPLRDSAWRVGTIAVVNDQREDAAPYREFQGIPRDHSRTLAYNLGVGVARQRGLVTVAADLVLEPAWRRSRGAVDTLTIASLGTFAPGARSDEGYFKFRNVALRAGVARDIVMSGTDNRLRLQAGAQLRRVSYTLEHHDLLTGVYRERRNGWREWTHSAGLNFVFPGFEFGYHLRVLSGMGRLGVPPEDGNIAVGVPDSFAAPTFPGVVDANTLYPVRVASHQMFFTVPIR